MRYCWKRPSSRLGRSRPCSDFLPSFLTLWRDDVHETVSASPGTAVVETRVPASDVRTEAPTHVVVVFESGRLTNVLWRDGAVRVSRTVSCGTPAAHMQMHRCCSAETLTEMEGE